MTNIKTRAAVRTALLLVVFALTPLVVYAVTQFVPMTVILVSLAVGFTVFFVGMLYEVVLARMQYEDKLKEMTKK